VKLRRERSWRTRGALWITGLLAGLMIALLIGAWAMLRLLRPVDGEWAQTLHLGPWQRAISMPAVIRLATHPVTLRLLEGRTLRTPFGRVAIAPDGPDAWRATCAPCALRGIGLPGDAVRLTRLVFTLARDADMNLQGDFALGEPAHAVRGRWRALLTPQQLELNVQGDVAPIADAFALFASTIPELPRAQVDGLMRFDLRLRLPERTLEFHPRLDGFRVAGLGTEALLNAAPNCNADGAAPAGGFGTWLPRAVIAAEDQRFHEHTGYDLDEIGNALSFEPQRGASTLSQQLARLVYTGGARGHARKLRELLYAVELDRTLGKARVMHLYLSLVPWGQGRCGAHAAAAQLLHKRVDKLTPAEAAWLASLLHNPDLELARFDARGEVNAARVRWVLSQMRPVPRLPKPPARGGAARSVSPDDATAAPPAPIQQALALALAR
jgi:hypothetical protein